ncbi:HAD family hydrolase [Enterovibrio calviensis]|uniref:HAD family hydrolase n=1 Tax=Enterovibrio calviensis TaxID=91359 RepID=UPI0004859C1B|nr:HAD-IA family hydrolase [Enterovibrio calviensis]
MKGKIKAVLFDLDGTLLDTAPDMANAANNVLRDHGLPPLTDTQIQANTSHGARGLLKAGFGQSLQGMDLDQLRLAFIDHYANSICTATTPYDGVDTLLSELTERKIPWGIMTNKPGFLTEMLIPYFPFLAHAPALVCADTLSRAKPHPDPLIYAAGLINVLPSDCLYVGDIKNDIVAAKAANMYSAVAAWGYIGDEQNPSEWDADLTFNSPVGILSLF